MGKIYYNEKVYAGGGSDPTWGNITGTLSNQTDLKNALDAKQNKLTEGDGIDIDANNIITVDLDSTGGLDFLSGSTPNKKLGIKLDNVSSDQMVLHVGADGLYGSLLFADATDASEKIDFDTEW